VDEKSLLVIDVLGNENMYQRKILQNWRWCKTSLSRCVCRLMYLNMFLN